VGIKGKRKAMRMKETLIYKNLVAQGVLRSTICLYLATMMEASVHLGAIQVRVNM